MNKRQHVSDILSALLARTTNRAQALATLATLGIKVVNDPNQTSPGVVTVADVVHQFLACQWSFADVYQIFGV